MLGGRIGPVLASWREELGWTQEELAHRAGISRGYLSRLERDLPEQPGLAVLSRVCGAMGHSWAELYRDAGINLPGDVTLADIAEGINDPELMLYLRRLPELDARDREVLRALLRFLFERHVVEKEARRNLGQQLALPAVGGDGLDQ
ncbi:MAG: helix-turn-helix domain-containing protein [Thermomicrobiales bacterium]